MYSRRLFSLMRKNKKFDQCFYEEIKAQGKKYCPMCKQSQLLTEFRSNLCVECSKEAKRKEYARNKDKYSERYQARSNTNEYCVYKFVDKDDQVIYIGKSKRLQARMVQHFVTDSHLSNECYDKVKSIFYCLFPTKIEMDIYEIYLIDKHRPQYNSMLVCEKDEISNLVLPELIWEEYSNERINTF